MPNFVFGLAFSADGQTVASGSNDKHPPLGHRTYESLSEIRWGVLSTAWRSAPTACAWLPPAPQYRSLIDVAHRQQVAEYAGHTDTFTRGVEPRRHPAGLGFRRLHVRIWDMLSIQNGEKAKREAGR